MRGYKERKVGYGKVGKVERWKEREGRVETEKRRGDEGNER